MFSLIPKKEGERIDRKEEGSIKHETNMTISKWIVKNGRYYCIILSTYVYILENFHDV
jgi:hypothetical protein